MITTILILGILFYGYNFISWADVLPQLTISDIWYIPLLVITNLASDIWAMITSFHITLVIFEDYSILIEIGGCVTRYCWQ